MEPKLSIKECLSYGWRTFKARSWFFVGTFLLVAAVSIIANGPSNALKHADHASGAYLAASLIFSIASLVISFLIKMGEYRFALKAHDAVAEVKLGDLLAFHPFWKFTGVSLLLLFILVIGFILLVIPGIMFALAFLFAGIIVMDKGLGPIDALTQSARITKGNRWRLLGLVLTLVGINILGCMALFVGLFVTMPVSLFAIMHAYRTLSSASLPLVTPVPSLDAAA